VSAPRGRAWLTRDELLSAGTLEMDERIRRLTERD